MRKFYFFGNVPAIFFLVVFLACQILSTSAADASQNISKQEKEKGFSENEVVVRIESPEKISGLSQRYNLLIIPLSPD